jgi:hypothetical protein
VKQAVTVWKTDPVVKEDVPDLNNQGEVPWTEGHRVLVSTTIGVRNKLMEQMPNLRTGVCSGEEVAKYVRFDNNE